MGIVFWRKTQATPDGEPRPVAATEETPLPVQIMSGEDDPAARVQIDQTYLPPVAGQTITRIMEVPGIGTGAAYADKDAFGTTIRWANVFRDEKCSGIIVSAFLLDLDDEGLQVDVPIFTDPITETADNSAFAVSDADLLKCRGVVKISTFYDWGSNQVGVATNVGLWVSGTGPDLYSQCVARGALNIAAGAIPRIGLVIVPD